MRIKNYKLNQTTKSLDVMLWSMEAGIILLLLMISTGNIGETLHATGVVSDFGLIDNLGGTGWNFYKRLVALAIPVSAFCAALCCLQLFIFQNEQKIDRARSWLVRIIIVFCAINMIPTIMTFAASLAGVNVSFDGYSSGGGGIA